MGVTGEVLSKRQNIYRIPIIWVANYLCPTSCYVNIGTYGLGFCPLLSTLGEGEFVGSKQMMSHDCFCALLLVLVVSVWKNIFAVVILQLIGNAAGALWFYNISFCAVISIIALCIS
jgi:hypothetical protein